MFIVKKDHRHNISESVGGVNVVIWDWHGIYDICIEMYMLWTTHKIG